MAFSLGEDDGIKRMSQDLWESLSPKEKVALIDKAVDGPRQTGDNDI